MIRVDPFAWHDADMIAPQDAQLADWPSDMRPHLAAMAGKGGAFTLRLVQPGDARTDGRVLAIMGVIEVHAQAGTAWALMAPGCWGHMGELTRIARNYLDARPYRRIDMLVRAEFAAGHRWARRLGFTREAVLRAWRPDGGDMVMHARIAGGEFG